ncbi:hypothetical protein [Leptothoe sp. PORK10 BA2]|uniref:hypothetical protein n=1 Tax=Leptothoe sp. PORK10 BA2 TaxID=3110254 RepID=UPI002B219563|nr:hypothetical protein [Leptothoe sp. PORK10 BA2]MEA5464911.1 hypothetical protein [Leptothoe sp. PORK10 BA2]
MRFSDFWKQEKHSLEPSNSDSSQQLDLFKKAEIAHRKRSTGATVFRRFTGSIDANGGDADAIRDSIQAETEELFDCDVTELYRLTGGTPNDRSTLPAIVQETYMANETLASFELNRMEGTIGGESQEEVNDSSNYKFKSYQLIQKLSTS